MLRENAGAFKGDYPGMQIRPGLNGEYAFFGSADKQVAAFIGFGGRKTQEDRLSLLRLEDEQGLLSLEDIESALKTAFEAMRLDILNSMRAKGINDGGSTLSFAVATSAGVVYLNYGDSECCIDGKRVTRHHVAKDPQERRIIQALGGEVKYGHGALRICDRGTPGLDVSRALGDPRYAKYMAQTAETNIVEKEYRSVMMRSDGAVVDDDSLFPLMEDFRNQGYSSYEAQYLAMRTDLAADQDNTSMLYARKPPPGTILLLGVFDGHGGSHVSEYASTQFPTRVYLELHRRITLAQYNKGLLPDTLRALVKEKLNEYLAQLPETQAAQSDNCCTLFSKSEPSYHFVATEMLRQFDSLSIQTIKDCESCFDFYSGIASKKGSSWHALLETLKYELGELHQEFGTEHARVAAKLAL